MSIGPRLLIYTASRDSWVHAFTEKDVRRLALAIVIYRGNLICREFNIPSRTAFNSLD